MEITFDINDQLIKDTIITALEGGSNYWYHLPHYLNLMLPEKKDGETLSETICRGVFENNVSIPIHDGECPEDKLGELNLISIKNGLALLMDNHPDHFNDFINEQGDAETADVLFQLAVMGEIVFG